jgi:hypothetical protein
MSTRSGAVIMAELSAEIRQLRQGAREAGRRGGPQLGELLNIIGDIAQMIHAGSHLDVELTLPEMVTRGVRVAHDICRDLDRGCAADTENDPAA